MANSITEPSHACQHDKILDILSYLMQTIPHFMPLIVFLKPDQHNDGVSLVPLLEGGNIPERALIWHYPHYGNQGGDPSSIIRKGDWKLIHYYEDGHEELYNLKTDLSETTDLAAKIPKIVKEMSKELFDYLHKVGAKYPKKDPEYSEEAEKEYHDEIIKKLWPQLEEQRNNMLSPDYKPNTDWWGSIVTKD